MILQIKILERDGQHRANIRGLMIGTQSTEGILATGDSSGSVLDASIKSTDELIRQLEAVRDALCQSAQDGIELETTIEVDVE